MRCVAWSAAVIAALMAPASGLAQRAADAPVPEVRFRIGAEELVPIVYPARYQGAGERLEGDAEWVREESEELRRWWSRRGPAVLGRIARLAGLRWRYGDIEVYPVRHWPVVSIEYPLVLALDAVRDGSREAPVPDEPDLRVLLLVHQLAHYLLDDPPFLREEERDEAYDHPLLAPGALEVESMVNWVVYAALIDTWGRKRLMDAVGHEWWRSLNPSHAFVVEELMRRWRLSGARPLTEFLRRNPPGSGILAVKERYAREAGAPAGRAPGGGENLTGTEYGVSLGESYGGEVFVAYVDRGSPADRAGVAQGDLLRTIEGRSVEDVERAQRRLTESWEDNREINVSVTREGRELFFTIER